tara:strand:- start:11392 stop:12405 length:1014 start_codon:yes stop_codon:yes gene_type:complete
MTDLSTQYLGLTLNNPLVASSSPLTGSVDSALRLQEAGIAALVMPSLFEEKILQEHALLDRFLDEQSLGHGEAQSFRPLPQGFRSTEEQYADQLHALKQALQIPVIASLNGITSGGWLECAQQLVAAGADALELNAWHIPHNPEDSAAVVEQRYLDITRAVASQVQVPVTVKLGTQFSAPLHLVRALGAAGARGVSLFNRFYQPEIDLDTLDIHPRLDLSSPAEARLRVRWAALLHGHTDCQIAVTGGFHGLTETVQALLAGADVVQLCSVLLQQGPEAARTLLQDLSLWLETHDYASVNQLRGSLSARYAPSAGDYSRGNYIDVLDRYTPPDSVRF